jgi:oligopeptide/dipeptide ABC transporter ATP-binding protein
VTEILRVENLTKVFSQPNGAFGKPRQMTAVRDVSFSVQKGDVVGIVGESGCGKSTLARLILRLVEPTSGLVLHDETDITQLSHRALLKARKNMAMVFQDPYSSLDPRYTVADCLAEPFIVQGVEVPKGRIEALLDQVGLSRAMGQSYPHQLSGGQRQRVGIARALALSPDLLILDEPTASLDVSIQAQIISLLKELQGAMGLTYIFISHDLGLVRYFCNRVIVMYLGSVVEELGDPKSRPLHPYTATLMGSTFTPDPRQRKDLAALEGEIPSLFDMPPGCAFSGRCPRISERCRSERPGLAAGLNEHSIACFNPLPA